MDHASLLAIEILKGSRRWVASRVALRRALDSKSATPKQIETAQKGNQAAAEELEALVMRLERFLHNSGKPFPIKRGQGGKPFPWKEMFGVIATGAKAVESALGGGRGGGPDVIDATPGKK